MEHVCTSKQRLSKPSSTLHTFQSECAAKRYKLPPASPTAMIFDLILLIKFIYNFIWSMSGEASAKEGYP